jgi:hypothetical protein
MRLSISLYAGLFVPLLAATYIHAVPASTASDGTLQTCVQLKPIDIDSVNDPLQYSYVSTLDETNEFQDASFQAKVLTTVFHTIQVTVLPAAEKQVNVFAIALNQKDDPNWNKENATQRTGLYFWLERGQECLVPISLMPKLDTGAVFVYKRLKK